MRNPKGAAVVGIGFLVLYGKVTSCKLYARISNLAAEEVLGTCTTGSERRLFWSKKLKGCTMSIYQFNKCGRSLYTFHTNSPNRVFAHANQGRVYFEASSL